MTIDGYTKTYGLLGNPVEHTRSPLIHSALAELNGHNMAYLPFRVENASTLGDAVRGAYALHIQGLNVTVPYKEAVLPYLQETDPLAEKIGAVNTLVRMEGGFKGYNTDMPGLYRAMQSDGVKIEGQSVIVLGAGGVARAVAMMLAHKAEHIWILNRTLEKAQCIVQEVNDYAGCNVAEAMALSDYQKLPKGRYLAIQATDVGMYPEVDRAVIEESGFYQRIHTAYDLIFNPAQTLFMKMAEAAGAKAFNGLKMLLYQGIIAYELWNECEVSKEQADYVYERLRMSL